MKHTGCLHFITLMNLLYLPTSVNCPQDIISHIQVVHRLQVKSMHSLIRVWFLNPFRLPSSQCEAYSQHLYRAQYVPYKIGKLQIQGFSEPTTPNKIKQSYHITQKAARSRQRAAFLRGKLGRRQKFSKK